MIEFELEAEEFCKKILKGLPNYIKKAFDDMVDEWDKSFPTEYNRVKVNVVVCKGLFVALARELPPDAREQLLAKLG